MWAYLVIVLVSTFLAALSGAFEMLAQQFVQYTQHLTHRLVSEAAGA